MYKPQVEQKVYIQHTFFNDECVYETTKYIMNEDGKFVDHVKVQKNPEEFSIRKTLIFIVEGELQIDSFDLLLTFNSFIIENCRKSGGN